jgi:DNA polymerase I-like protein with 3'-5' exonuclease and polymerase domains
MNYKYVESEAEFQEVISLINEYSAYAVVDLETTGLDPFKDSIVDVQIAGEHSEVVTIAPARLAHCLRLLTARPVGHNLKFDITFLYRAGVDVLDWQYHDTMLMGHLADENRESYSLDSYVKELWNDPYKEEFWSKYKTYGDAPPHEARIYGAKDIVYTRRLYLHLLEKLKCDGIY